MAPLPAHALGRPHPPQGPRDLSLAVAAAVAAQQARDPPPAGLPGGLADLAGADARAGDALAQTPGALHRDTGWAVASPFLRRLADLPRVPLGLGRLGFGVGSLSLRFDGQLRLGVRRNPLLGGRMAMQLGQRQLRFTLPGLTLDTRREPGLTAIEVGVVLFDRRF